MPNFRKKLQEIIRVDHAGEFGAKVIYDGQIAALKLKKDEETLALVKHMKEQEVVHFDYFDAAIKEEKIRPTLMQPIWRVGGFALGFLTAAIDKKAAMVCTTAVEEIIDEHYKKQIDFLETEEKFLDEEEKQEVVSLKNKIKQFRDEELEHRDIGYENHAKEFKAFTPLSSFIKATTKFAIAVSKKV
ncbi:MAG: demethoxyubiquinone hydroxylase family protein [Rickettsiales bacterium]|nr:demethoxyubiquinone hydroxylase family protein [Rickettsiales bacterium]